MQTQTNGHNGHATKTDFVLAQKQGSAADVVKLAKARGIKMSLSHVYNIRAVAKKKRVRDRVVQRVQRKEQVAVARSVDVMEQRFVEAVLEIGLVRARALLERIEKRRPF